MRLLYCHIKYFRNFRDQEERFVDDYDISYADGKLSIKKLPVRKEMHYLYGHDATRNLSVVIGRTGAGKTNLLQIISLCEYFMEEDSNHYKSFK